MSNTICADGNAEHVRRFARSIVPGRRPVRMEIQSGANDKPLDCFFNVRRAVERDGGEIVFGWSIWEWPNVLIEAEHHAVWRRPDNQLVDVTPARDGEMTRLFLADENAIYDFKSNNGGIDNIRTALNNDPTIAGFIDLSRRKYQFLQSIPGVGEIELQGDSAETYFEIEDAIRRSVYEVGMRHTPPNARCFCGSGLKFKKCCRAI